MLLATVDSRGIVCSFIVRGLSHLELEISWICNPAFATLYFLSHKYEIEPLFLLFAQEIQYHYIIGTRWHVPTTMCSKRRVVVVVQEFATNLQLGGGEDFFHFSFYSFTGNRTASGFQVLYQTTAGHCTMNNATVAE